MGDCRKNSVSVLLHAAGRTDLAIKGACDDLVVVACGMAASMWIGPGLAAAAYSALSSECEVADSVVLTDVNDLAGTPQASAR